MTRCDIAVVGGGASGMAAAIQAKRVAPSLRVAVLERQARVGKKLLATGNGRCNLTNLGASQSDYHGGTALMRPAMAAYPPSAVIAFFGSLGVEPLFEGDKVYPLSEQAGAVVDALRLAMDELGVELIASFDACSVEPGFTVRAQDGQSVRADRLILAAGGMASPALGSTNAGYKLLESLGHKVNPCLPALVQLTTDTEPIRALSGIKCNGEISILVDGAPMRTERGEVLFTDYGLSGPPVLQLSRIASEALHRRKRVEALLSIADEDPTESLKSRRALLARRPMEHFLTGLLNKRLGQTLIKLSGCGPLSRLAGGVSDLEIEALAALMHGFLLTVTGTMGMKHAQVTAGGADTREFSPDTLQSRLCPGLFATGELLDIDGDCGGYNLQWAWASGLLAGTAAAGGRA